MADEAIISTRSHPWKSQRCQCGHNLSWHDGNWNDPIPHIFRGCEYKLGTEEECKCPKFIAVEDDYDNS